MRHRKANSHLAAKLSLTVFCVTLALAAGSLPPGYTQAPEKRKLNVRTFNRMPLKVREVRNLQKEENWFRDLEIAVENISNKPIYFISLIIEFPNIPAPPPETMPDGTTSASSATGFRLTYGEDRLMNVRELAAPGDTHLKPGETYVFTIPEARVVGLEYMKKENNLSPQALDKIEIRFDIISLGDGTGYIGGQRMLYSKKKGSNRI